MIQTITIIIIFILVYIFIVRPRIKTYRYVASVETMLAGYKTVILSTLAGITPMLPSMLDQLHAFSSWAVFFEQATANKIAAGCALLAMITHSIGLETAAKAEPRK